MPSTSTHLHLVPHVWSIVSGNGLLPDRHQAISPVPKPLLTYTLLILLLLWSCYLIDLFITVHKIWIEFELELKANELNWNRIERFWIRFELELNLIEKSWIQLELELNWIERNELIRALVEVTGWWYCDLLVADLIRGRASGGVSAPQCVGHPGSSLNRLVTLMII